MVSIKPEARLTPPYAPWPTFKGFLDTLKSTAIPSHIDPSVMARMSGSAMSQVRTTLRFLDLMEDSGLVTKKLRELVAAYGTEDWKDVLSPVIYEAYVDIVGDLDLDSATLRQLVERFRTMGNVSGSVLRKALRFYLAALNETGSKYSPHLRMRGLSTATGDRRPLRQKDGRGSVGAPTGAPPPPPPGQHRQRERPPGTQEFHFPLPGKSEALLFVPDEMGQAEWDMIDGYIRNFIKLRIPS
jgi:hypothetical protein